MYLQVQWTNAFSHHTFVEKYSSFAQGSFCGSHKHEVNHCGFLDLQEIRKIKTQVHTIGVVGGMTTTTWSIPPRVLYVLL